MSERCVDNVKGCADPDGTHRHVGGFTVSDGTGWYDRPMTPTPAPAEAVDILATVIGTRTGTRYDGVPDRSRDLATMFLSDLTAAGWTLTRAAPSGVPVDVATPGPRSVLPSEGVDRRSESPTTGLAGTPGAVTFTVETLAAALWYENSLIHQRLGWTSGKRDDPSYILVAQTILDSHAALTSHECLAAPGTAEEGK